MELAWIESVEDAGLLGYEERASDTYFERAHHLAAALPGAEDAAFALARAREAAAYSAAGASEDDARAAQAASDELRELAREQTPWLRRVGRWIDPRSLVRVWRRDHAARQRRITLTARGDLEQERELVGSSDRGLNGLPTPRRRCGTARASDRVRRRSRRGGPWRGWSG